MNTRSATLNSSLTTPSPIGTKIEKEVTVKKRQRYIWPEAQFVRLMHSFAARCAWLTKTEKLMAGAFSS
jgi:hypothetical protein